jgi:methylmalonyl-CoA mutase, N-terminal domain
MYPWVYADRPPAMRQYAAERVIVGVNRFTDGEQPCRPPRFDPAREAERAARLATQRKQRDHTAPGRSPSAFKSTAAGAGTCFTRFGPALGEVCDALRDVWGDYKPERI